MHTVPSDPTKRPVAIYLRTATLDQQTPQAIETQRQALTRFAEQRGLQIVGEYQDAGPSGLTALEERPSGADLLAGTRRGDFSTVLATDWERLSRHQSACVAAFRQLRGLGVTVETPSDPGVLRMQMMEWTA
jgi:DNA invertase Pin-like site-specific DNA recombinase